jgi:hypothetical protein
MASKKSRRNFIYLILYTDGVCKNTKIFLATEDYCFAKSYLYDIKTQLENKSIGEKPIDLNDVKLVPVFVDHYQKESLWCEMIVKKSELHKGDFKVIFCASFKENLFNTKESIMSIFSVLKEKFTGTSAHDMRVFNTRLERPYTFEDMIMFYHIEINSRFSLIDIQYREILYVIIGINGASIKFLQLNTLQREAEGAIANGNLKKQHNVTGIGYSSLFLLPHKIFWKYIAMIIFFDGKKILVPFASRVKSRNWSSEVVLSKVLDFMIIENSIVMSPFIYLMEKTNLYQSNQMKIIVLKQHGISTLTIVSRITS